MQEFLAGTFDIAVIGAGHAGVEAALAAARMGCRVVCFTINLDAVGNMPCLLYTSCAFLFQPSQTNRRQAFTDICRRSQIRRCTASPNPQRFQNTLFRRRAFNPSFHTQMCIRDRY